MEQARLFIAIVLSFIVFFLWELFFVDREAVNPPPPATETARPADTAPGETSPGVPAGTPATVPGYGPGDGTGDGTGVGTGAETASSAGAETSGGIAPAVPIAPPRTLRVDTPLYTVTLSEDGAVFTHFVLKKYRETATANSPLKELIPEGVPASIRTGFADGAVPGIESARFQVVGAVPDTLRLENSPQSLAFAWTSQTGVTVEKRFVFSPDTYLIGFTARVINKSQAGLGAPLSVTLAGHVSPDSAAYAFQGPAALIDGALEQVDLKDIKGAKALAGPVQWMAVERQYFISALIPRAPADARVQLTNPAPSLVTASYVAPAQAIAPGGDRELAFDIYFGPKSLDVLSGLNNRLDRVIDFGWFEFIAKPCLWMMNVLYDFIPNYGVAIIILTIMIKLLLWPLGNKGYKSMNEMKKLQPEMARLREKHKDDKKKMNEELMALYRTYKINPMGGCLPMILQIPVFIALYRMLYGAIELRHAHFFGWINDLSAPDRLFNFDIGYIPLMQPPYGIPVLTIVMGATMFFQQKMSPPPGDPAQAKMMTFLPIVFTFIFINFPSGLVLYWLVNNVLSIAQQHYVSKKNA